MKLDCSLCRGCQLEPQLKEKGYGIVHPEGSGGNGVALVGESPEFDEVRGKHPFAGRAGFVLTRLTRSLGEERQDFIIFNTVQCRVPGGHEALASGRYQSAVDHCKVHRDAILEKQDIHTIVPLGNIPLELFTGVAGISTKRGYVYWSIEYGKRVIATYHPSYLRRGNMQLVPSCLTDIRKALSKDPTLALTPSRNELFPTPQEMETFTNAAIRQDNPISYDIETPYSKGRPEDTIDETDTSTTIVRISFAYRSGNTAEPNQEHKGEEDSGSDSSRIIGITVPWSEPYITYARRILATDTPKISVNGYLFDMPRLVLNDSPVNGPIVDIRWLFHFLYSDLPLTLSHIASHFDGLLLEEWKSLSDSDPEKYSWIDAVVPVLIYEQLCKELDRRGLIDQAWWQVVYTLGVMWKMRQRGICIDEEALDRFRAELDTQLLETDTELQDMIPQHLKNVHPKNGYKILPKNLEGLVLKDFVLEPGEIVAVQRRIAEKKKIPYGIYQNLDAFWFARRYCKVLPFKTSTQQMQKLMMHLGDEIPIDHKTKRPTTGKKFIQELENKVYGITLQHREIKKMVGTYAAWPVQDGMVHPILTLKPRSGRLSCKHPNFQNITQPGDEDQDLTQMAHKFRQVIVARSGHVLNRRDYNAIEAVLTGYFAGDEDYMKLAALSIYAWVTGMQTGVDMPSIDDPALGPVLREIKKKDKVLYKKFKTCVLGIGYGLGPKNMHIANPGVFEKWTEAAKLKRYILGLFPKIQKWQVSTVARARIQHYVQGPMGNIRWFWDIPGADNNKAMAQNPQGTAAAIIKRAMIGIDGSEIGGYLVGQIHDELIMDFPEGKADEYDEIQRVIMEAPIPELGGLVIPTDRKVGRTLDD